MALSFPKFHVTTERDGAIYYVALAAPHWHNGQADCQQRNPTLTERFLKLTVCKPIPQRSLSFRLEEATPEKLAREPSVAVGVRDAARIAWFMMGAFKGVDLHISRKSPVAQVCACSN